MILLPNEFTNIFHILKQTFPKAGRKQKKPFSFH